MPSLFGRNAISRFAKALSSVDGQKWHAFQSRLVAAPVDKWFLFSATVVSSFSAVYFALQVRDGLSLLDDPDELEQFVVGVMLTEGHRLYRDVFSHHGPFPYMIAQIYATFISSSDFSYIRLFQALLALASCAAVAFSPVLKSTAAKMWAGAFHILLLSMFWNVDGTATFVYYKMSGFFFVIVISQCVLPSVLHEEPSSVGLTAAGIAGSLACLCAYSNGPAVCALVLVSVIFRVISPSRGRMGAHARHFLFGACCTLGSMALWIFLFADFVGFFVYHFYFNQYIYAKYIAFSATDILRNFEFYYTPQSILRSLSVVLLVSWLYIITGLRISAHSGRQLFPWVAALGFLVCGIALTNPRGGSALYDNGFFACNVALFGTASAMTLERSVRVKSKRALINSLSACTLLALLASQMGTYAESFLGLGIPAKEGASYVGTLKSSGDAIYRFVRSITGKSGDLLVLNYFPTIYVKADRRPASGNLFYHPWQAEYNRSPKYGYRIDVCSDIKTHRPTVIWFFNWRISEHSIDEFEPCVIRLIVGGYTALSFDSPWYIRNDVFRTSIRKLPPGTSTALDLGPILKHIMQESHQLSFVAPIQIEMTSNYKTGKAPLRRIGILLATHDIQKPGDAELHLYGDHRSEFHSRFALSSVRGDRYRYFNVDLKWYETGEIRSLGGEGISTWDSTFQDSHYTCVIYEYIDGTRGYTPACPIS